jgi:hypothetical protein
MPGVFKLRSPLRDQKNLATFCSGKPTVLMQLKVGLTKGKKATDVGSSLGVSSL